MNLNKLHSIMKIKRIPAYQWQIHSLNAHLEALQNAPQFLAMQPRLLSALHLEGNLLPCLGDKHSLIHPALVFQDGCSHKIHLPPEKNVVNLTNLICTYLWTPEFNDETSVIGYNEHQVNTKAILSASRLCHGLGNWLLASYCRGLGLTQGQSTWNVC